MSPALIDRARAYVAKMPSAVDGAGGRPTLFRAAKALIFDFDLPEPAALTLLREYNERCLPPFSERELMEKLASAQKDSRGQRGRLKEQGPLGNFTRHATPADTKPAPARPPSSSPSLLPQNPEAGEGEKEREKERAAKRAAWPASRIITDKELQQVATLRGVRFEVVRDLAFRRILQACTHEGRECFTLGGRRGRFRQIRHLDGSPVRIGSRTEKIKALPGSVGRWIDEYGRVDDEIQIPAGIPVLIVEGVIGILEAMEARHRADDLARRWHRAHILARVSANSGVTAPILRVLAGHHVRIIPDKDPNGIKSAEVLHLRIQVAGGFPQIIPSPAGKDIGPALTVHPPGDPIWPELLTIAPPQPQAPPLPTCP